jgi:hypothetical protein
MLGDPLDDDRGRFVAPPATPTRALAPDTESAVQAWLRLSAGVLSQGIHALVEIAPSAAHRDPAAIPINGLTRAFDVGLALSLRTAELGERTARLAIRRSPPLASFARWVTTVPRRSFAPEMISLAYEGRSERLRGERQFIALVRALVPAVVEAVLDQIDITQLVLDHVKLRAIVAEVDVDEVAARLNMTAVVDRLPMDEVFDRVDFDALIDRIPISKVVDSIDLDAIAERIDVDAIAQRLNIEAVIDRVDLAALAKQVIDSIDLPEIIRESTGSMTSETVLGVRMQGIQADQRISRVVDKLLLRHGRLNAIDAAPSGHDAGPSGEPDDGTS